MTKSGKHCGKRRNCTFCAISYFVTMFSKSRLLQRCPKAFILGKGLTNLKRTSMKRNWPRFRKSLFMKEKLLNRVENYIVAEGEIAHDEKFLLLPQCFLKSSETISLLERG